MALTSAAISGAIIGASPYSGSQVIPRLALAIGESIVSWISVPTNVLVQGTTSGFVGAGVVNGTMQFVVAGQIQAAFASNNIVGQTAPGIAQTIENGLSSVLSSAQYSGTSAAVGTGTDTSKVSLVNSGNLIPILLGNMQGQSIAGMTATQVATGLAQGIGTIIQTGFGFGAVTGPAGNIAAVGTSVSTIF